MKFGTDVEIHGEQGDTQPPLDWSSVTDVEDLVKATGESHAPPQPVTELPHELEKESGTEVNNSADELAVHEQTYREIVKILEREERKLNERRKQVGSSSSKSKKLVQDMFELCALKQFNSLWIENHRKKARKPNLKLCPSLDASITIARRNGKTEYYARRLREKLKYLHRVGELQTSKQGRGATHQSFLSVPQVAAAIQAWAKGTIPVDKGGYTGLVRHFN